MTSLMRLPPSSEAAAAGEREPRLVLSETNRPDPIEGGDTTGDEGGGAGGWDRSRRVEPETRKQEPPNPEDRPKSQ